MKKILTTAMLIVGLLFLVACESGITIAFETNGGNEIADVKLTLDLDLYDLEEPTKTGNNFAGWYTDANLENEFDPAETITENITLYAKWTPLVYTVSISIDGVITTQTVNYNENAVLPPNPTKVGYTFTGWSSEGKNIKSDLTITASFLLNAYTITFVVGEEELFTRTVNHGGSLGTELIPVVPEVTGKNGVWNQTNFTNITSNITVTAIYTDKVYTVTYVNKEGDTLLGNASFGPFEVPHGTVISEPNATDTITGYDFVAFDYDFEDAVTGNLTIVANYTRKSYSVTFRGLNGIALGTQSVLYGNDATAPAYSAPEGYTLGGWDVSFVDVASNLTVNMLLIPNEYTIVFNTGEGSSVPSIVANYLSPVTAPNEPTLTDMVFQGWYLNAEGTGNPFIFTSETKMPLNGLTLYAIWDFASSYNLSVVYSLTKSSGTQLTDPIVMQMDYLETYSPNVVIEGYDFVQYTVDGVDYNDINGLITVDSTISVVIHYQIKTFTITFTQNPAGTKIDEEFTVEYNATFTAIPALTLVDGKDVMWDREVFNNIQSNILVGALYFSNTLKRVVFMDGTVIKYIAVQEVDTDVDIISNNSALTNLTKPGYVFIGWYDSPSFTNQINFDTFKYNSFEGTAATIYAKWEPLIQLATPVVTNVTDTTITWYVNHVNGLYPVTFKLLLDGVESIITPLTTVPSGSLTTYTYIAEQLDIAGTHTIKLISQGVEGISMSSVYSNTFTHVTEADPVEVVDETLIYDYFLIEKAGLVTTYIFYTDMVYNFDAKYDFTITEGGSLVSANDNKLNTNSTPGHFSFDVYNSLTLETKHYQGEVVTYISQFALGSNLNNYISSINPENDLFLSDTVTPYLVGSMNDFHFDIRILDSKGARVEQTNAELLYKFYLWNGASYELLTTNLSTYLSISEDYIIDFKTIAEGKQFKVEIDPKYEATKVQSPTLSFEFKVNNGYNVFTDADLKTYFADFSVQSINIHSTIIATLAANQLNADGTPVNGYATPTGPGSSDGTKIYANPYIRMSGAIDNDNLVINGNYFTINGSNLPYMKVTSDPDGGFTDTGFDGSFDVVSVQVAILYYNVFHSSNLAINNNHVAFNNLTLVGNTSTPAINYSQSAEEILLAEQLMSRNSGGYVGITVRAGNSHIFNSNIGLMTIGVTTNAYGLTTEGAIVTTHIDHSTFYNEWANSIFGWASSQITITACDIGLSGGAAIHVEDNRPGSGGAEDPTVNLDALTTVNNWVSGQEAWFKAYGMTGAALAIKTNADGGIAPMNKTIIRLVENPVTGLETEMFNFVLLTKALSGADSDTNGDQMIDTGSEFLLNIPNGSGSSVAVDQAYNFLLGSDPRIMSGNFVFAINDLLDSTAFMTAVGTLMATKGLGQGDAANLVYMAAFHNITPDQAYNLYGAMLTYGLTWQQAYGALGLTGQAPNEGRYMEISAQVAGLGPIIMITEYFAKTAE